MLHMPGTWQITFDLLQGAKRIRLTHEASLQSDEACTVIPAEREARAPGPRVGWVDPGASRGDPTD